MNREKWIASFSSVSFVHIIHYLLLYQAEGRKKTLIGYENINWDREGQKSDWTVTVLWIQIRIKLKRRIRICINVISWIRIRINLQIASQNVWKMNLLEHFFKVLSFYLEARIRIPNCIKVKGRVGIRIKATRRIRIRIRIEVTKPDPDQHQSDPDPQNC